MSLFAGYIADKQALYDYTGHLKRQRLLAVDIETSSLSPYATHRKPEVGCIGIAWSKTEGVVFPICSRVGVKIRVPIEDVLAAATEVLENETCQFILHFGKLDFTYLAVLHGIWIGGFLKKPTGYSYDTGQMSYCLDERNMKGLHDLKTRAWKLGIGGYELNIEQYEREHPEAGRKTGGNFNLVPAKLLYPYNICDCVATFRLFHHLKKKLIAKNLWKNPFLFPQMAHNWTSSLLEITGIKTNLKRNEELKEEFPKNIARVEKDLLKFKSVKKLIANRVDKTIQRITDRVYAYKRKPINPQKLISKFVKAELKRKPFKWTPDDRRTLIYDILRYKIIARTEPSKTHPEGQPSINKKAVIKLLRTRTNNKVLEKLVERGIWYYGLTKYVNPIPSWVGSDGRTHTTYKPQGQRTGRVGSENPNHENLPKHNDVAPLLRSQFVPTNENYVFLSGDEKQMELRLMCDRANDEIMRAEFEAGKDPHTTGAQTMNELTEKQWNAKPKEEQKQLRTEAKSAVSFGLVYGRSADALAADFGKSLDWAQDKKEKYFAKYKRIPEYWAAQEDYAKEHKFVLSFFGRRRHVPDIDSEQPGLYNQAVRVAINSPIQGDASDITWIAGYRLYRWLLKYKLRSRVLATGEDRKKRFLFYRKSRNAIHIHDDVTVDCYIPELPDVIEKLQHYMTDRHYIESHTGWFCSVKWDIDFSVCRRHLGKAVELARNGNEFILPKELLT